MGCLVSSTPAISYGPLKVLRGSLCSCPVAGIPGFFVVAGFSGHGIMHSPSAGRAVAEMIVRGRSESVDVEALSLERFARGELIHETMVL